MKELRDNKMKILYIALVGPYTDGMNYQENILPRFNKLDGHDVLIITSTETFVDNGRLGYVEPSEYMTEDGVRIKRLPYRKFLNQQLSSRIRLCRSLYKEIEVFAPDVIMSHDLCYLSVLDLVRYMKKHPQVKLYADTHTAAYNSGRNWISLNMQHRMLYHSWIQKVLPYVSKYFYIGESEGEFSQKNYGVPKEKMEFYPLGGIIPDPQVYEMNRRKRREELGLLEDELLFVHSGKLDALKRTEELLKAFSAVPGLKAKLAIIGSIPDDMQDKLQPLIWADERISYLGWRSGSELLEYLCACDLYLQPGSVSATLQNAICCGCAVMAYPHENYTSYGYDCFLWVQDEREMKEAFKKLVTGECDLNILRKNAQTCARELLDYKVLARRLYE